MRLHQLEYRARMLECVVDLRVTLRVEFIAPCGLVVGLLRFVPAGEESPVEGESFFDQERRIGVELDVVARVGVVSERVINQASKESNICSGAYRRVHVGYRSGAIEPRIHRDELRLPGALGFHDETETDGMIFGR